MSTSQLGNSIDLLSKDQTLISEGSVTTDKVTLVAYGSISIMIAVTQNATIKIEFANDGFNWDYDSTSSLVAGSNGSISSVVLAKYCRLTVTNSSTSVNPIRFSTYASINPTASWNQIVRDGNNYPSVLVDNINQTQHGSLIVAQHRILNSHKFDYASINSGIIQGPDRNLKQSSATLTANSEPVIVDNILYLPDIFDSPANSYLNFTGPPTVYIPGNSVFSTFSFMVNNSGYDPASLALYGPNQAVVGMGHSDDSMSVIDGVFLGYPTVPLTNGVPTEFSLIYYNNGVETYVQQKDWNIDTLDGQGKSSMLLDINTLNVARMRTSYHGSSSIYLEIAIPWSAAWAPCHTIQVANLDTKANFKAASFSYVMHTTKTSLVTGVVGGNQYIASGSGQTGLENSTSNLPNLQSYAVNSSTITLTGGVLSTVLSLRAGDLINGKHNRSIVRLISVSYAVDGTKPVKFHISKGGTYTAPTWAYTDSVHSPVQNLALGTYNFASGSKKMEWYSAKANSGTLILKYYELVLTHDDTIVVRALSANSSDVEVSITYTLIS